MSETVYWAGPMHSLRAVEAAQEAMLGFTGDVPQPQENRLLSVEDGVGTISIHGPLTNSDSPFNAMFGLTSYSEIREAFIAAAEDPDVKSILMDVSSGGGAVTGLEDTAKLIDSVKRVKPVVGYADQAASAAYWLLSSADKIYASRTSMLGSIGVIARHAEQVDALQKEGVTVTTIRAGREKALANPYERLSIEGKAQIQQGVDAVYKVFVEKIAASRGKSYIETDERMAQGKEFIGQAAVDAGLADGIKSFDEVVSEIKRQSIDPSIKSMDTRRKVTGAQAATSDLTGDVLMKKALTEQQLTALAAGVTLDAQVTEQVITETSTETVAGETVIAATDAIAVPGTVEKTAAAGVDNGMVSLLKEQLAAAQNDLISARVEVTRLTEREAALEAVVDPLKGIVSAAVNNMSVALGGTPLDLSALSGAEVLARHQSYAEQFKVKFKAGGVAAVVSSEDEKKAEYKLDTTTAAQIRAIHGK